jgi:hypothetical protein
VRGLVRGDSRVVRLFTGPELRHELEGRRGLALAEVENATDDYLLGVDAAQWLDQLLESFGMDEVVLRPDDATWEASDVLTRDRVGVTLRATYRLPFDGRPEIFAFQPNLYGPIHPEAELVRADRVLIFEHAFRAGEQPDFEVLGRRFASDVARLLGVAIDAVQQHKTLLERELIGRIGLERNRVIEARAALESLPIPLRARPDAPKTYTVPGIERRPSPAVPKRAAGDPISTEPALLEDFYEHIIDVIRSSGKAMERTHGTFSTGSEPQKRDVLLVMLNSHYQGAAAGEVFNGEGKADIVLRFADHNILVAECKIWDGIQTFKEALDQLEGYLTLRDTRAALIFFVRTRHPDQAVREAQRYIAGLPGAAKVDAVSEGTDFRFRLPSTKNANRGVLLHTLFFHVPLRGEPRER